MLFISSHRWKFWSPVLIILSFLFISCKKKQTVRTPAELLPQKWYVSNFTSVYYNSNGSVNSIDTIHVGNGADYIEFGEQSMAYIHFSTVVDTIPYVLLDAKTLPFDQDTMKIDVINETMLQYSRSNRSFQPFYDDIYRFYR